MWTLDKETNDPTLMAIRFSQDADFDEIADFNLDGLPVFKSTFRVDLAKACPGLLQTRIHVVHIVPQKYTDETNGLEVQFWISE